MIDPRSIDGCYPEVRKRAEEVAAQMCAPPHTHNDQVAAMLVSMCERIDALEAEVGELRFELLG